ncbi:MAG: alpha/beta hydrolase [Chloroflexi bacterium]|jgi:pimeloyl-ACP methyl ester carboxylesterase|nr:alpha/beta hydrolase [Chloroflexota bacterium]
MTDPEMPTQEPAEAPETSETPIPVRIPPRPAVPNPDTRPVRKDEMEVADRGLHVESWLPERRSRRKPLLFVHGELGGSWVWERYLGYFARRGWEGHALNLRNHYWSQTADPARLSFASYTDDVVSVLERIGPNAVVVGHGMGGLLALKAAERHPVSGLVLVAPYLPRELRVPPKPHEIRSVPPAYGCELLGWDTMPERLRRDHRDLTLEDIVRIKHLLGQKPREAGAARRSILQGVPVDRRPLADVPLLVIGAGLDRYVAEPDLERLAQWLGARYEPFGAHSHFGLVLGEDTYQQVADAIREFLEEHRL